jgi:hypothetical protein
MSMARNIHQEFLGPRESTTLLLLKKKEKKSTIINKMYLPGSFGHQHSPIKC